MVQKVKDYKCVPYVYCHLVISIFSKIQNMLLSVLKITLKTEIIPPLHTKMPVIRLVILTQLKRHIKMIIILINTKTGKCITC